MCLTASFRKAGGSSAAGLQGGYLHGSAVMGCFNPQKSDIDLFVAVNGSVPDDAKAAFMDMLVALNGHAPEKGIEMDMVRGDVGREAYLDSILCDVDGAVEDIGTNTAYIVLNLLRVLAFKRDGAVLSKKEGGEWGLAEVPEAYRRLIRRALDEYLTGRKGDYSLEPLQEYAAAMLSRIRD